MQKKTRLSLFKANTFFWQTLAGLIVAMTLSGFLVFAVAWGFLNPDHTLLLNHPGEDRVIFAEEVVSLGGKPALTSWLQNQNPGPDHARVYADTKSRTARWSARVPWYVRGATRSASGLSISRVRKYWSSPQENR